MGSAAPGFSAPATRSSSWKSMAKQQACPASMGFSWTNMSYQEKKRGQRGLLHLRPGRAPGLPGAVRPVRKLVPAHGGHPGGAPGPFGHGPGRVPFGAWTTTSTPRSAWCCSSPWPARTPSSSWSSPGSCTPRANPIADAAVQAAKLRFRPILMTSFAFILGVVPLLSASGAGGASQRAVGTAVFGGMLASTLLAVMVVPVFYVVVQGIDRPVLSARAAKNPGSRTRVRRERLQRSSHEDGHPHPHRLVDPRPSPARRTTRQPSRVPRGPGAPRSRADSPGREPVPGARPGETLPGRSPGWSPPRQFRPRRPRAELPASSRGPRRSRANTPRTDLAPRRAGLWRRAAVKRGHQPPPPVRPQLPNTMPPRGVFRLALFDNPNSSFKHRQWLTVVQPSTFFKERPR